MKEAVDAVVFDRVSLSEAWKMIGNSVNADVAEFYLVPYIKGMRRSQPKHCKEDSGSCSR